MEILRQLLPMLVVLLGLLYHPTFSGSSFGFPVLDYITIETKSGPVKGQIIKTNEGHLVTQFLGLPFARPPLGDLRFREPVKHSGWAFEQALEATSSKSRCHPSQRSSLQEDLDISADIKGETGETSEDCLYLDIHVPGDLRKVANIPSLQLPVLIELGENDFSSFGKKTWQLSTMGDIIVINVAYRQGVLGYFWLPDESKNLAIDNPSLKVDNRKLKDNDNPSLEIEGNVGLLDQRLAIHWVWDNILAYGGKPDQITLLGQDEASVYVWLHALSAQTSGMFSRAITHGPTITSPGFILPHSHVIRSSEALGTHLGCNKTGTVLSCMSEKSMGELLEGMGQVSGAWGVMVEDEVFIKGGLSTLLSGMSLNTAEFLIGTTSRTGLSCDEIKQKSPYSSQNLRSQIDEEVKRLYHYSNLQGSNPAEASAAVTLEYSRYCSGDIDSVMEDLRRDTYLRAPAELTARLVEGTGQVPVYLYELILDSSCVVDSSSSSATQLSAQLLLEKQQLHGQQQKQLWRAWVNFVKYGNPGAEVDKSKSESELIWSRFTDLTRHWTVIQTLANSSFNSSSRSQQLKARRMAFWNSYMPHILHQQQHQSCVMSAASSHYTVDSAAISGSFDSNQLNIIIWSFIGVTVLLLVLIVLLLVSLCSARSKLRQKQQLLQDYSVYSSYSNYESCWDSCCSCCVVEGSSGGRQAGRGDSEARRLRHLPYREET